MQKLQLSKILSVLALCFPLVVQSQNLPNMGSSASTVLSPQQEQEIGETFMRALRQSVPIVNDPLINEYINSLGYRLVEASPNTDTQFHFFVISDPSINAFAAIGGYVGIHTGLIIESHNESELASVMAHEIAHVTQKHVARMIQQQQQLLVPSLGAILAAIAATVATAGALGPAVLAGAMAGGIQRMLNFSRSNEREADYIGIQILEDAGFDPHAMTSFFERLQQANRFNSQPLPFLSTHPVTEDRIADSRSRAESYPYRPYRNSIDFYLTQARVYVYHNPAQKSLITYQEYIKDDKYPYRAAAQYGYALALLKSKQYKAAREEIQKLRKNDPSQLFYIITETDIDQAEKKYDAALKTLEDALKYNPGNYPLRVQYALVLFNNNQPKKSAQALNDLSREQPSDTFIYRLLAQAYAKAKNNCAAYQAQAELLVLNGNSRAARAQLQQAMLECSGNEYQQAIVKARLDDVEKQLKKE